MDRERGCCEVAVRLHTCAPYLALERRDRHQVKVHEFAEDDGQQDREAIANPCAAPGLCGTVS